MTVTNISNYKGTKIEIYCSKLKCDLLITLQDPDHTLIIWLLASEWTLSYATTMRRNTSNFLYSPGHVTLWCLKVVLVAYASLARSSTRKISCLKWRNIHVQLTTWYGSANHSELRTQNSFYSTLSFYKQKTIYASIKTYLTFW